EPGPTESTNTKGSARLCRRGATATARKGRRSSEIKQREHCLAADPEDAGEPGRTRLYQWFARLIPQASSDFEVLEISEVSNRFSRPFPAMFRILVGFDRDCIGSDTQPEPEIGTL